MNILLIKPYWRVEKQSVIPPLGIMSLAACLREKMDPSPQVRIVDQRVDGLSRVEIRKIIEREKPDIIGLSALSVEAGAMKTIADDARKILPKTLIVAGGPHATVFYDLMLGKSGIDIAVLGEGEQTFLELAERVRDASDWSNTPGIAYMKDGKLVKTDPRPPIDDLDSLPYPAWDMIDIDAYTGYDDMNGFLAAWPHMPVFTSRACPYGCIYCHQIFGKKFRARSVESVVEEFRRLVDDHGVKEIHIVDDIFNWDVDRAKDICRGIIAGGIKVKIAFPNGVRGDKLDDELLDLLYEAGCYCITFAIESASPRIQKLLKKFANLEKLERAIEKAYERGMVTCSFFVLGFPTETAEEMEQTIHFALRSKLCRVVFFSAIPFPRTRLYDLFKETYPEHFTGVVVEEPDALHYFPSFSSYSVATGTDLTAVVKSAYSRFYLRPTQVARLLNRYPWNRRLLRGMYHGFRAVFTGGKLFDSLLAKSARRGSGMDGEGG